jgi:hypothetical protein
MRTSDESTGAIPSALPDVSRIFVDFTPPRDKTMRR